MKIISGKFRKDEKTGDWVWSSDEEVDSDDETIHSLDKKKGLKQSQVSERKLQLRDLESHVLCLGSE